MMSTFLNLSQRDGDRRIYRVLPLKRLYELFERRENVLVSPRKWSDPFENGVLSLVYPRANLFGQCWTRHAASDAMWRIYSADSDGVRIRTTVQVLSASLSEAVRGTQAQSFIGGVSYLRDSELIRHVRQSLSAGQSGVVDQARTLLLKRRAFQHEREVRLILVGAIGAGVGDLIRCRVDPGTLIDQIMVNPYLEKKKAERLQDQIHDRTGFPRNAILRSLLYTLPSQLRTLAQTAPSNKALHPTAARRVMSGRG